MVVMGLAVVTHTSDVTVALSSVHSILSLQIDLQLWHSPLDRVAASIHTCHSQHMIRNWLCVSGRQASSFELDSFSSKKGIALPAAAFCFLTQKLI
jgi:hypothetical protein